MMDYNNGLTNFFGRNVDVPSGNRTHNPSVTFLTVIPLLHQDNPTGKGASLWFCGILAEGIPIMLTFN